MTVSRIPTPFRGSQWRQRFADRMIVRCPGLNPDAIDEMADQEYEVSGELEPEAAADRYMVDSGFADLGDVPEDDGSGKPVRASGG